MKIAEDNIGRMVMATIQGMRGDVSVDISLIGKITKIEKNGQDAEITIDNCKYICKLSKQDCAPLYESGSKERYRMMDSEITSFIYLNNSPC